MSTPEDFEKSVPRGTDVIAFTGPPAPAIAAASKGADAGADDGGSLAATFPEGLFLASCGELVSGFETTLPPAVAGIDGLDALVTSIKREVG